MYSLTGKVIVITGASMGLGKSVALRLAKEGATLILFARSGRKLDDVAREVVAAGGKCSCLSCDITNPLQIDNAFSYVIEAFSRIDILVNNAGIWHEGPTTEHTPERIRDLFEVNAIGTILASRAVIPQMKTQREGQIFNVISLAGVEPSGEWAVYTATKHAVAGFVKSLTLELKDTGIKVMGLYPGGMNTALFDDAGFPKGDAPWMMNKDDIADIITFILRQPPDVVMNHVEIHKRS